MTTPDNNVAHFGDAPTISESIGNTAQKWRLAVLSDNMQTSFGIAELVWFSKRTKIDLATALVGFKSSDGSDFHNAIDGDSSTVAYIGADSVGGTGIWIELDFKIQVDASKIVLDTDSKLEHCVSVVAIQYWDSNDLSWKVSSYLRNVDKPSSRFASYGKS